MTCIKNCKPCKAREGYLCHGDFFSSGKYMEIITTFDIDAYNKIESVKHLLDPNTINILKVLICDSERFGYFTELEIIDVLDEISSKLSDDNKGAFL